MSQSEHARIYRKLHIEPKASDKFSIFVMGRWHLVEPPVSGHYDVDKSDKNKPYPIRINTKQWSLITTPKELIVLEKTKWKESYDKLECTQAILGRVPKEQTIFLFNHSNLNGDKFDKKNKFIFKTRKSVTSPAMLRLLTDLNTNKIMKGQIIFHLEKNASEAVKKVYFENADDPQLFSLMADSYRV